MSRTAVIILNWNGRELMRRYLPSVVETCRTAKAKNVDVDVIVADNASTDGSVEMLRQEFPTVGIIEFDENHGFAIGYNKALAAVDHDYVVLLNSDVAASPGWIEPLVAQMDADPTVAACGPKLMDDKDHRRFEYAGAAGGFIDMFCYPFCRGRVMETTEEDHGQYDQDTDVLWMSGAALMVRRQLYLDAGGLDEDFFAHMEEIDLCWRLVNKGMRIRSVGRSRVYHLGGATLSSTNPHKTFLNFRNNLMMLVKNHNSRLWWAVLLARMVLDGVAGLKYMLSGQAAFCRAIVMAHIEFWQTLGETLAKRRTLKQGRSRRPAEGVRRYSMIWKYYAGRKKTFTELEK